MKNMFQRSGAPMALIAAASMLVLAADGPAAQEKGSKAVDGTANTFACTLPAPELRERRAAVREEIGKRVGSVEKIENGYRMEFGIDDVQWLVEFISFERGCCSFKTFSLQFEPNDGPVWFGVTAPKEAKSVLDGFLAPLMPSPSTK